MAYINPKDKNNLARQMAQQNPQYTQVQDEEAKQTGLLPAIVGTGADVAYRLNYGLLKGLEGVVDLGASIGGAVAGIFSEDAKNSVADFVQQDYAKTVMDSEVGKYVMNPTGTVWEHVLDANGVADDSLARTFLGGTVQNADRASAMRGNEAGEFVGGMITSVGQMLPSIAMGNIGGAVAGASGATMKGVQTASKVASMATLGVSASGGSTEEALADGADLLPALGYGAIRGATEVATEMMTGGIPALDRAFGTVGKSGIARVGVKKALADMAGEGFEEIVSEAVNPATKAIYKGGEAFKEYTDPKFIKDVALAGVAGAGVAGIMNASTGNIGKTGDVNASVGQAEILVAKRDNLDARGSLSTSEQTKLNEQIKTNYVQAEGILQKMSEKSRERFISSNKLGNIFDKNGTIREKAKARLWGEGSTVTVEQGRSLSSNMRYDSDRIKEVTDNSKRKENIDIKVHEGKLTADKKSRFETIKTLVAKLNADSDNDIGVVLADVSDKGINAYHEKGSDVIVVNEARLGGDDFDTVQKIAQILIEEVDHSTQSRDYDVNFTPSAVRDVSKKATTMMVGEDGNKAKGTRRYQSARYLDSFDAIEKTKAFTDMVDELTQEGNPYEFTREQWDKIQEKGYDNPELTSKDRALIDEVEAHAVAKLLAGDEEFIRNYTENHTATENFLHSLEKVGKWFGNLSSKSARAEAKQISEVRKTFIKALTEKGYIYQNRRIIMDSRRRDEENTRSDAVMFNLAYEEGHYKEMAKKIDFENSALRNSLKTSDEAISELNRRMRKVVDIWNELGGELNSQFMEDWNNKTIKDRAFDFFKNQAGYKYNAELATMCKKGIPLFEAIDQIVRKEVMQRLGIKVLGKAEKEILYDVLKAKGFDIPCAICYVEQARQREGTIIHKFINGDKESGKLGWNNVLDDIESRMAQAGVKYKFERMPREIANDKYQPKQIDMDNETGDAFFKALMDATNDEIVRINAIRKEENKRNKKQKKILSKVKAPTGEAFAKALKGNLPSNLNIFKTLATESGSRMRANEDLFYSSLTTLNLAKFTPNLYKLFNSQGGVSTFKTKQGSIIYWGDVLRTGWDHDILRENGGLRNQSNSDFMMFTLLDQAQFYADLTAKGYYLHAYTKVLSELKLFGLSGAKINASLIPLVVIYYKDGTTSRGAEISDKEIDYEKTRENAGLDEDGNPIFDNVEGINATEAFMLVKDPEYSKNICGICIGYSNNHIAKLLDDDRVQLIIGYHDKTNDPNKRFKGAKFSHNYNGENEAQEFVDGKWKTKHIAFNKYVQQAEKMFGYDTQTEKHSKESVDYNGKTYKFDDIPRLAVQLYLDFCEKHKYRPAYSNCNGVDFSKHPNYYKLLGDFGLYNSEGHYAPQRKVNFNMPDKVPYFVYKTNSVKYMDSKEYIKKELKSELKVRDDIAFQLSDKAGEDGIIPTFINRMNRFKETGQLSDYDNANYEDEDIRPNLTFQRDEEYLSAVEDGNMDVAQRMVDEEAERAMPNSVVRTKDGKLEVVYHGTNNDFTVFDTTISGGKNGIAEGFGIYLASSQEVTKSYGSNQLKLFANITHPARSDKKTIGRAVLRSLIKKTCKAEAEEFVKVGDHKNIRDALKDTWISNYVNTYEIGNMERAYDEVASNILRMNDSDMDVVQEVMVGMGIRSYDRANEFYKNFLTPATGIDGYATVWHNRNTGKSYDIYLAFNSSQLKKADAVTYDDKGNPIPLSERFSDSEDIRFSRAPQTDTPEFKRWFGDSKIVNDDGTPKVMYHGSAEEFNVFSKEKIRATDYDAPFNGFWFSSDENTSPAFQNAKYTKAVYLSVQNPAPASVWRRIVNEVNKDQNIRSNARSSADEVRMRLQDLKYDGVIWDAPKVVTDDNIRQYKETGETTIESVRGNKYDLRYDSDINGGREYYYNSNEEVSPFGTIEDYIRDNNDSETVVVVFEPTQIKSADAVTYDDNGNPIPRSERFSGSEDIRFNLASTGKEYSNRDAKKIIDTITESNLLDLVDEHSYMEGTITGKGKLIEELAKAMTQATTQDEQLKVARSFTNLIVNQTVMREVNSDFAERDAELVERANNIVKMMSAYRHRINFEKIQGDVKYKYDDKWKRYALQWKAGENTSRPVSPDQLADAFNEIGIQLETDNEIEIFLEAMDKYEKARNILNNQNQKWMLAEVGSAEELGKIKEGIFQNILKIFNEGGKIKPPKGGSSSTLSAYYEERLEWLRDDTAKQLKFMRSMWKVVKSVGEIKLEGKRFASDTRTAQIEAVTSLLKGMVRGQNLLPNKAREMCKNLAEWYSPENALFKSDVAEDGTEQKNRFFLPEIQEMVKGLAEGEGKFSPEELKTLSSVLNFLKKFVQAYKRVIRNGRYVDAEPIVKRDVDIAGRATYSYSHNALLKSLQKIGQGYALLAVDPETVAHMADGFMDGFFTEQHQAFRDGAMKMMEARLQFADKWNAFFKQHKKYKPTERMVTFRDHDMDASTLISLYMTTKRKQAWLGLAKSGFDFDTKDGKTTIAPIGSAKEYTDESLKKLIDDFRKEIEAQLTETDLSYIAMCEELINDAKRLKVEVDMERFGLTNATEDYYYPILRGHIADSLDADSFSGNGFFDRVSTLSMNKDTVKGASGKLYIKPVEFTVQRHLKQTSMYYGLAEVIDNYNVLMNYNLSENKGAPVSVLSTVSKTNFGQKSVQYFKKMLKDLEGMVTYDMADSQLVHFTDKLRGNVAVSYIAGNPKVIFTQLSSLFAGTAILSYGDIAKGIMTVRKNGSGALVDQYSQVAKYRNADMDAVRAETLTDKVGKVGEFLMKGVSATDRLVIMIEFSACQNYVARTQGLPIGSKENLIEAGKLLDRVIYETQQSAIATEKSGMARSGNVLGKTLAMFRNDAMKQVGRVIDGIGYSIATKEAIKNTKDEAERKRLENKLKTHHRDLGKALGALMGTAVWQAVVGMLASWFLRRLKDKDKEEIAKEAFVTGVESLFTGLPIVSQILEFATSGYGVEDFTFATINDALESVSALVKVATDGASKENLTSALRKSMFSVGQMLGIPTRNIYNYFYGTVSLINEQAGYKLNSVFYNDNYRSELNTALEKGDYDRATMLGNLLTDSSVGGYGKQTKALLSSLVSEGYKGVLPRTVDDTITVDGVDYALKGKQQTQFKKVYGLAEGAIANLNNMSTFQNASTSVKASAVRFIYDTYYNLAVDDLLGTDTENKNVLFAEAIPVEKLALIVAQAKQIQADTDKAGNVISGSKKKKVIDFVKKLNISAIQKYMIMGYLGYANTNGKQQVEAYIKYLKNLSANEKKQLLEYSGYSA